MESNVEHYEATSAVGGSASGISSSAPLETLKQKVGRLHASLAVERERERQRGRWALPIVYSFQVREQLYNMYDPHNQDLFCRFLAVLDWFYVEKRDGVVTFMVGEIID